MGGNKGTDKIDWIPRLIYGGAVLRFVLKDFDYVMDEGLVLIANDEIQARRFVTEFCCKSQGSIVEVSGWKKRRQKLGNYCSGIMKLKKSTSEEEATEFLAEKEFLPIIICGGILPDYLRCNRYIFRLQEEDIEDVSAKEFKLECMGFRSYCIENMSEVCQTLRELGSSVAITEYAGMNGYEAIYGFSIAVGAIYVRFLRRTHLERETLEFFKAYIKETAKRLQKIPEFASGDEIPEMLSTCVWEYMYENSEIILADAEAVGSAAYEALNKQQAVLFDDEFYYFPDKLLMEICRTETMSSPELKEKLNELEIIYCYGGDKTVKKTITLSYGIQKRVRLLWVRKEYLFSPDNLRLEDIFCAKEENT